MKELREFVKSLKELGFGYVGIQEVFSDDEDNARLININEIVGIVKGLGVKEVGDVYYEEISFITNDNKYIEIVGFC